MKVESNVFESLARYTRPQRLEPRYISYHIGVRYGLMAHGTF